MGTVTPDPSPHLSAVSGVPAALSGVVLVLHGGQVEGTDPVRRGQLAALRLEVLGRSVAPALRREGVATYLLRFGVRGWNGALASPVADARWALEQLRERHGDVPAVLVGHSMGGRTALRVAGSAAVRGVLALAPWVPSGEPVEQLAGRRLVIAHGDADRITSPADSLTYARRAAPVAREVVRYEVAGDGHGMLRRFPTWNALVRSGVLRLLADGACSPGGLQIPR